MEVTDSTNYVGVQNIRLVANLNGFTIYPMVQFIVTPLSAYVRDPTKPNHITSTCDDTIYPFYFGNSLDVIARYF